MPNIKVTVAEKIATNMSPGVLIVCGNSDYTVTFTFDSEWTGIETKTARFLFYKQGKPWFTDTTFTGDTVQAPVLRGVEFVLVGAYAGELRTTTPARILCSRSILCDEGTEVADGPTRENLERLIAEVERQLESGAFIGPAGPAGADGTVAFEDLTDEQRESLRGPQGIQGPQGETGPQGEKGADGTVAFEDLTDEQHESLRGPQGIQGAQGEQGVSGVWVGNEKPADEHYQVWVNPDGNADNEQQLYNLATDAYNLADQADKKVDTLREVVSKFHSNIVETASGEVIVLDDASDMELAGLRIYGKTTQNGTPTPEAPVPLESVGDGGSVGVTVAGKNLLKKNTTGTTAQDGVTFTTAADGSITVNGTADATTYLMLITNLRLPKGTYKLTGCPKGGAGATYRLMDGYGSGVNDTGAGIVFESTGNRRDICIRIGIGTTCNNLVFKPMISTDLDATYDDYEPYKETQTLTIQKPTDAPVFLPGIPVTSGGNYTDENGKQWVCDEVDFARGKYVQNIGKKVLDGSENWSKTSYNAPYNLNIGGIATCTRTDIRLVCDRYPAIPINESWTKYDYLVSKDAPSTSTLCFRNVNISSLEEWKADVSENPITVLYILKSPIEHDLSAEELAQYAALHTNYPNTTIVNDVGADMKVKYVADTKLYIDKKFYKLAQAMLNQ